MKKNIGSTDRIIRLVLALVFFSLFFILKGDAKFLGIIGIVPLGTALLNFCPLYTLLGMNTDKK